MQAEFEARPEVSELPAGFAGDVETKCHAMRIRNRSTTDNIMLNVSGTSFTLAPGETWGISTDDLRAILMRPWAIKTGNATALLERIYFSKL